MRPEANSLDLNNFPEDFCSRDAASQASGDSSSSAAGAGGYRKKKSGGAKEDKDEAGKVYECRFCSLKFCKSQALGGHMNRHRQERETETLNKARQLVFSNDLAPPPPPPHLGYVPSSGQAISHGGYHQQGTNTVDDTSLHFRSMYPSRMYPTSPIILPPPPPLHPYPSPPYGPGNDYYVGHVVPGSCYGGGGGGGPNRGSYYTCIGAPVVQNSGGGGGEVAVQNQEEGLNWGRR